MSATVHAIKGFDPTHETLTVKEFARRVHRSQHTVWRWIRTGQMPPGTVLDVQGHYEIDWTLFSQAGIRPTN